ERLSLHSPASDTDCRRLIADDGNGLFSPQESPTPDAARGPAFFVGCRLLLPPASHSSASGSRLLFLLPGLCSPAHSSARPFHPPLFSFSRSSSRRPSPEAAAA